MSLSASSPIRAAFRRRRVSTYGASVIVIALFPFASIPALNQPAFFETDEHTVAENNVVEEVDPHA